VDSSVPDVANDASTDASDAPDGPFCQTHPGHAFCADFDEGSLTAGFTANSVSGTGASTALDDNDNVSAPASFLATLEAGAQTSVCNAAQLIKNLANNGNHDYHLELDFEPCGQPSNAVDLFGIYQNAGIDSFIVSADAFSYKLYTEGNDDAGTGHTQTFDMGAWPASGWHHLVVDASDLGGAGASRIHVTVDGTTMLDVKTGWSWTVSLTQMEFGLRACNAWPSCVVHYDNILLDAK
jgi:hypothetical protein